MKNEFVCTIDGQSFSTKGQLVEHMLKTYTSEHKIETTRDDLIESLRSKVSYASFMPFFEYEIEMKLNDYHDSHFRFSILPSVATNSYTVFSSVDEVIHYFNDIIQHAEDLRDRIQKMYHPFSISITNIYEPEGAARAVDYQIQHNGKTFHVTYLFDDAELFIDSLAGVFSSSVEGKFSIKELANSDDAIYCIGDVPLYMLLERGDVLKIAIVKESDQTIFTFADYN